MYRHCLCPAEDSVRQQLWFGDRINACANGWNCKHLKNTIKLGTCHPPNEHGTASSKYCHFSRSVSMLVRRGKTRHLVNTIVSENARKLS